MDERELSLAVVGIAYPNGDKGKSNRQFNLLLCTPGDRVELRLEPENNHDANAVAVFGERGTQLGYLTAERAPWVGSKIRLGEEWHAVLLKAGTTAAVIRVRFGGGAPTLPLPQPPPQQSPDESGHGDDFYPDPEGSEWGA